MTTSKKWFTIGLTTLALSFFIITAVYAFGLKDLKNKTGQSTSASSGASGNNYTLIFKNNDSHNYPLSCKCMVGSNFKSTLSGKQSKTCTGQRCSYHIDLKASGKNNVYSGSTNSLSRKNATFDINNGLSLIHI